MTQLIRTNPGILISLLLLAGAVIVSILVGFLMSRQGLSLRPIYWFMGFFALVVLPQLIGHLFIGVKASTNEAPRLAALEKLTASTDSAERSGHAKALFGPDVAPQMITDVRQSFGDVFSKAEFAQFAVLPDGGTVLLAKFDGYSSAEKAWIDYLRVSGLNQIKGEGDSQRGFAVSRPSGDRAYALHMHNMVGIWTGQDDAAIRSRMLAGGFEIPRRAPLAGDASARAPGGDGQSLLKNPVVIGLALAAYVLLVVAYFFKGTAWAGSVAAKPGVAPASSEDLAARLDAINSLDVPFRIERGSAPDELIATWRYADAKWVDLARVRGLRRTFRVRLKLDAARRVAQATDYTASFDWSAGRGGAELQWRSEVGIVFFQYEHQRVFGLRLDQNGRFKPELSYAYTFNPEEMKAPLKEAITSAGWTYRPTVWLGPKWLRWLTE